MSQKFFEKLEIGPRKDSGPTIILDPEGAEITLGGTYSIKLPDGKFVQGKVDGDICVKNKKDKTVIWLQGAKNRVLIKNNSDLISIQLDGQRGNLSLLNDRGEETIRLEGNSGDIILENADCAEEFEIADQENIFPGTVVIFDEKGLLRRSDKAYDKRVAGVISGNGDKSKPGIILGRQSGKCNRVPLALIGKVFCKVDAQYEPVKPGDMLTTSPTPGFAMKVSDPSKAFGSVIGKALGSLSEGMGLIPIIVTLK